MFYVVAFAYLCVGRFYTFAIYILSDVLHELGHSVIANKYGVKLNEILLMPYGAVASGKAESLTVKSNLAISFAGPLTNLLVCLTFVTLWWLFPESYAFTDEIVTANFGLFLVNMLPVYGLDGGRIAECLLAKKVKEKAAKIILKTFALAIGLLFVALFVYTCFNTINFSLLFFGGYLLLSPFTKTDEYKYLKISDFLSVNLPKGVKVNGIAISDEAKIVDLLNCLDVNAYNVCYVYSKMRLVAVVDQAKIIEKCKEKPIFANVKEIV